MLLAATGEARFAEEIERTAYNDLLGAQAPDGEDWCYYSFANGRRVHTTYWRCCKSSGAMAMEELPSLAYGVTAAGEVAVTLLGPSSATLTLPTGGEVRVEQRTDYPFAGRIDLIVEASGPSVPVLVRIPAWASGATVNDEPVEPGSFARIDAAGAIAIDLPMTPILHRRRSQNIQHSLAPDGSSVDQEVLRQDYIALTRGPLVLATDLIDGFKTDETVRLGDDAMLEQPEARVLLSPLDRAPIAFEPYYRAGGRHHGAWRLTWLRLPPERAA